MADQVSTETASKNDEASGGGHKSAPLALAFLAIGVVYGDIGTSPLYAFKQSFASHYALGLTEANVLGILSLIFWSLIIVVSLKYLSFVVRADNRGEGGMLALMALVVPHLQRKRIVPLVTVLALFGASLLYGDGMITPAISVLSAMEGLEYASHRFVPFVLPLTIGVLIALFIMQSRGTRSVGRVFAPVMLVWFITLAILGVLQIVHQPRVLLALWPGEAVSFFVRNRIKAFLVLGSVFLAITGAEALYADMGHFGRQPIRLAWFALVLPSLVLNYFGQGALLLRVPGAIDNPFFQMAPTWALYPLIALSTCATVIASQAVISGAFSLTWQAVQMGFLPRVHIAHTSGEERGQVYIGVVNWILMFMCIVLVLYFENTDRMANAYGVAVTTDMVFTTLMITTCARTRWNWSLPLSLLVCCALLTVDLPFWLSNLTKIPKGGWVPLVIAVSAFFPMLAWKKGRDLLAAITARRILPVEDAIAMISQSQATRVAGTAVFMSRHESDTPATLLHNLKHNKVVHDKVVLLTILTSERPTVPPDERVHVTDLGSGFHRIVLQYGFTDRVDVPASLRGTVLGGKPLDLGHTTYFLGRETLIVRAGTPIIPGIWKRLFVAMSRNAESAMTFFRLPPRRVVELGAQIEILDILKEYNRAYFDRWYRSPRRVVRPEVVRRKVRLALGAAEYVLNREIRSVLDVGCGEGPWRTELRRVRPALHYLGADTSEYVVERYGRTRNIKLAGMGELGKLKLRKSYDLIVCADMLEYVPRRDMARGLATIARVLEGVAYLEAFTTADELVGDREGWHHRTPAMYRTAFKEAGLVSCGLNCYVTEDGLARMNALEIAEPLLDKS